MLKLPKFTFLCGPRNSGQIALARAISDQDEEINFLDFEEPIRNATQELLFDGFNSSRDMVSEAARAKPISQDSTLDQFYDSLELQLRNNSVSLGGIAYASWYGNGMEAIFDRFLYRDCRNPDDMLFFINRYADECLAIHLNSMAKWNIGCKQIWLPTTDTAECMANLTRELGTN